MSRPKLRAVSTPGSDPDRSSTTSATPSAGELDLRQVATGIEVAVKGLPGSRKAGLRGVQEGAIRVGVTQVAEKGKANAAILETLAEALGIRRSRLTIVAGATSSQKRVLIEGLTVSELLERLAE